MDRTEQDEPGVPEYSEVVATAPIASKPSDFAIFAKSNDIERVEKESAPEEEEKGDAITIALPLDNADEDKAMVRGENEVGAMAATSENGADSAIFAKKEGRMRRKQERALRHVRKTKRNLRLASVTEGDGYAHESQTEALELEGACTTLNNIGSIIGIATRATELSCEVKTGKPAKDGMAQSAKEEEAEEQMREKRRIERRE